MQTNIVGTGNVLAGVGDATARVFPGGTTVALFTPEAAGGFAAWAEEREL